MTASYDDIAKQYQKSKTLPFREYVEWYTYRKLLGEIAGKSVLDLACGEGFYTRRIKDNEAGRVLGVDLSAKMIELARQQETANPLGIDYLVGDALELGKVGSFDLVVASYLLNYARTREKLLDMCRTIAVNLKPGGRFVSINNNPDQPPESFPACKKYGFAKRISGPLEEGVTITYEFHRKGQKFSIANYYLSRKTHEWAFNKVGLTQTRWVKVEVDPGGIEKHGRDFWRDFIAYEPIVGIECRA